MSVEPNYERQLFVSVNDPYIGYQWWVSQVQPQSIWSRKGSQQKNIVVAVIDSGIATNHEDLQGRIQPGGYNFYSNNTNVSDVHGHGTMVAGVISATSGNGIGISGITGAYNIKVLPLKVSHASGSSRVSDIVKAIDYAISSKVDVINLSLGSAQSSSAENAAVQRAIQAGITVVAAAGNEALKGNSISYPASYEHVISVGAVDQQNSRAAFSNYNPYVSVVAPGTEIYTTDLSNSYSSVNGTSFSAPMVAGAAAIAKSLQPDVTPQQIKGLLEDTATDLGNPGKDSHFGAGLLNLERLNSKLTTTDAHIPVSSIELNTTTLTIDLDQTKSSASMESNDIEELESMRSQAAIEYEREPNDSFLTANPLTLGNGMVGSITRYYFDVDHYRFTLHSQGRLSLLAGWVENSLISHWDNKYLMIGIYNAQQQLIDVARLRTLSDGEQAMYYSDELPKGTYYLVVLQSSPYQYVFTNERYLISSLFTPNREPEPTPEPKPVFSFDKAFMQLGQLKPFVTNIETTGKLSSSTPQVATVDSKGNVQAVGHGATTIRYSSNTISKEAQVKVSSKSNSATAALFEKILPANATDQSVTWTSSNPAIAEVDEHGIIVGKKVGTTVVSAKTKDGGLTASTTVTVIGKEVQPEFVGDFPSMTVKQDKTFTITFNKELQVGKDYSTDILIARSPNGNDGITTFTTKVDASSPNKLYITPNYKWDEGTHYLTVSKNLQNKNSASLAKDTRMKFEVLMDFQVIDTMEVQNYERLLEMLH
ncbi:S8 family serine peptidase [Sporosarcina obsidiansis]|uniref:S8 family serine peptidase n=1 Tax=Sporosarcina obsidiansis TaxID=2660748 RepID=UPI0018912406|nr:S8 family serine peptidase [Sporosarcina obsidiansis]